jgi:hypothetical protein
MRIVDEQGQEYAALSPYFEHVDAVKSDVRDTPASSSIDSTKPPEGC